MVTSGFQPQWKTARPQVPISVCCEYAYLLVQIRSYLHVRWNRLHILMGGTSTHRKGVPRQMWGSDGHFCNITQGPSLWKVFTFKKQMRHLPWCNDWSLFFILALCRDRVPTQANPQNLIQQHQSLLSFHHMSFRVVLRTGCDSEPLKMDRGAVSAAGWSVRKHGQAVSTGFSASLYPPVIPARVQKWQTRDTVLTKAEVESLRKKKKKGAHLFCFVLVCLLAF